MLKVDFYGYGPIYVGPFPNPVIVGFCQYQIYLELMYLVIALVPSETACMAYSPGRRSLTAVWISLEVIVDHFFVVGQTGSLSSNSLKDVVDE